MDSYLSREDNIELDKGDVAILDAIKQSTETMRQEFQTQFNNFTQRIEEDLAEAERKCVARNTELSARIDQIEFHERKYNLIVRGLAVPGQGEEEAILKTFLTEKLEIAEAANWRFVNLHRLGQGIICRFHCWAHREQVLTNARRKLKGTRISVITDLPATLRVKRTELVKKAAEIRQGGKQARVIERGADIVLQTRERATDQWQKYED